MNAITWRGILAPLGKTEQRGLKINMSSVNTRTLPIPLRYRESDLGEHIGAKPVGLVDEVWIDGQYLWGKGRFDPDDVLARKVARKVRNGFVRHLSADIVYEPKDRLAGVTIVDIPAFDEAEIKEISEPVDTDERELEGAQSFAAVNVAQFSVVGDLDLPFAPREREWDSSAATQRVAEWATTDGTIDPQKYRRAFFYQDEDSDPTLKGSYKLPFADVIDGRLTAVPRGVFAAAGGRGVDAAHIPQEDKETIKRRISRLYRRMADRFDDPEIIAPWDREENASASAGDVSVFAALAVKNRFAAALHV